VTETIQYEQFDEAAPARGQNNHAGSDLARLGEVPMELSVELGRTQLTVAQTLDLRAGAVVPLERPAGAPADLLVNGTPIARGEVVVIDEQFGLRLTQVLATPVGTGPGDVADSDLAAAGITDTVTP